MMSKTRDTLLRHWGRDPRPTVVQAASFARCSVAEAQAFADAMGGAWFVSPLQRALAEQWARDPKPSAAEVQRIVGCSADMVAAFAKARGGRWTLGKRVPGAVAQAARAALAVQWALDPRPDPTEAAAAVGCSISVVRKFAARMGGQWSRKPRVVAGPVVALPVPVNPTGFGPEDALRLAMLRDAQRCRTKWIAAQMVDGGRYLAGAGGAA